MTTYRYWTLKDGKRIRALVVSSTYEYQQGFKDGMKAGLEANGQIDRSLATVDGVHDKVT